MSIAIQSPSVQSISADEYHKLPGVSNSRLSDYIEEGPAYYWWKYLSGEYEEEQKDHFDFGSAVHDICLLGDRSGIVEYPREVLGKGERRGTNDCQAFEAEHAGKIILKPSEMSRVLKCVDAVFRHPIAGELLRTAGPCERMYCYHDTTLDLGLRTRPDKLVTNWHGNRVVLDLKKTTNTRTKKFVKSITDFGYHRQEYFYRKVLSAVGEPVSGFAFVAVRDKPPHSVEVYRLNDEFLNYGAIDVENALASLADRTHSNNWEPVSHRSIIVLDPPNHLKYSSEYAL